jgi:hypothetical protein
VSTQFDNCSPNIVCVSRRLEARTEEATHLADGPTKVVAEDICSVASPALFAHDSPSQSVR